MITATETDTNLPAIMREAKLYNLVTTRKYHTYGLRQDNNPVVEIEFCENYVDSDFLARVEAVKTFLELNGLQVDITHECDNRTVSIGLRIDLRKTLNRNNKPLLAASVLSTIVYSLEDRLDIDQMKKYKLASIPAFPVNKKEDVDS